MANTKSARKAIRVSARRAMRNKPVRSATKTFVRRAESAISTGAEGVDASVVQAIAMLDKAAAKGVIHANNAARKKSRLMKKLNQARATA